MYKDVLCAVLEVECLRWDVNRQDPLRRLSPALLQQIVATSKAFEQAAGRLLPQVDEDGGDGGVLVGEPRESAPDVPAPQCLRRPS